MQLIQSLIKRILYGQIRITLSRDLSGLPDDSDESARWRWKVEAPNLEGRPGMTYSGGCAGMTAAVEHSLVCAKWLDAQWRECVPFDVALGKEPNRMQGDRP